MKTTKWIIDPTQSETSFKVRKLMITNVMGKLEDFEGKLETNSEIFETLRNIQFKAKIASIKTDDEKRDEHLKSADFFDMEAHPYLSFTAKIFKTTDTKIQGDLNIRGISRPVIFDAGFLGTSIKDNGETRAELTISGKVNRRDFGLTWNGKNEAGDIIVGDDIQLKAQVLFIQETASTEKTAEAIA